jgi:hypothetical protein
MQVGVTVYLEGSPPLLAKRVLTEDGGASRPLLSGTGGASADTGASGSGADASDAAVSGRLSSEEPLAVGGDTGSEGSAGSSNGAAAESGGSASEAETQEKLAGILRERDAWYRSADCSVGLHGEKDLGASAPEVAVPMFFACVPPRGCCMRHVRISVAASRAA